VSTASAATFYFDESDPHVKEMRVGKTGGRIIDLGDRWRFERTPSEFVQIFIINLYFPEAKDSDVILKFKFSQSEGIEFVGYASTTDTLWSAETIEEHYWIASRQLFRFHKPLTGYEAAVKILKGEVYVQLLPIADEYHPNAFFEIWKQGEIVPSGVTPTPTPPPAPQPSVEITSLAGVGVVGAMFLAAAYLLWKKFT